MMDMFDGHGAARTADVPTDGDAWRWDAGRSRLVWNPNADGNDDSALETATMTATGLRTLAGLLAQGMEPFFVYDLDDTRFEAAGYAIDNFKILTAANLTMLSQEVSWCDRCSVLALHDDGANKANRQELWQSCQNDATLSSLVGESPEPDLRLNALDCSACPAGETSDANGQCVPCADTVVGNDCIVCGPDVVFDGTTLAYGDYVFDTNQTGTGDTCPNVLVVEIQNPDALFLRADFDSLSAQVGPSPQNQANCEREYTLITEVTGGREVLRSTGSWPDCQPGAPCIALCSDVPGRVVTEPQVPTGSSVRFSAPALPNSTLTVFLNEIPEIPE